MSDRHHVHPDGAELRLSDRPFDKLRTGFVDWFSRRVFSCRLSITLETDFWIKALEEALTRFGAPEIFKTDRGSHFTSMVFTAILLRQKVAISMDGHGAWRNNMFVERL